MGTELIELSGAGGATSGTKASTRSAKQGTAKRATRATSKRTAKARGGVSRKSVAASPAPRTGGNSASGRNFNSLLNSRHANEVAAANNRGTPLTNEQRNWLTDFRASIRSELARERNRNFTDFQSPAFKASQRRSTELNRLSRAMSSAQRRADTIASRRR